MTEAVGALAGVRVVDLTDERGIYGAKLLADLGADVVRPEPPTGDPLRNRGPHLAQKDDAAGSAGESLWHAFFASSRRFFSVDPDTDVGIEHLRRLIASADIVLAADGGFGVASAGLEKALADRPELVVVDVSSFGADGPWRDYLAPDLVAGALGGAVATTGDADTPPLKTFGELNFMVSGVYLAIAALSALFCARATGAGQRVHVPVHECIASCLEHVFMWYWYQDKLPSATGLVLPRRGSLHWSNAYTVMQAQGGSIMITPTPDWEKQIFWLVEEDVHEDLIDPKYLEPENLPLLVQRLMEVLTKWVGTKDVEQLFLEAQERHSPYGWVLPLEKVAENPQLEARSWWTDYQAGTQTAQGPGAPYHFADTPWSLRSSAGIEQDTELVLDELAWLAEQEKKSDVRISNPSRKTTSNKPLNGVKILDFTHVLAGPFATRILGDMGADVVKINSADRATGANDPNHPYYLMWNRNKRALALNMSDPAAQSICKKLADEADIVIDNFSVGVLDRWGVGYDTVSTTNEGVIYVQMSGMGDGGPWSKFVTYAPTIHALAGLTHMTGVPDREDIGIGFSYNDHQAGLHGSVAILAALEARRRTGKGQRVDVSQFEVGVTFAGPSLLDYFANGHAARPTGNRLPYDDAAPHGCYPCAGAVSDATEDERWVAIACITDDQWSALKTVMGSPRWANEVTFETVAGRLAHEDKLNSHVSEWTRTRTAVDVMQQCQANGVPAGVVQTGVDLAEHDPQLELSDFLTPIADINPNIGQTYADRLPIHFSSTAANDHARVREVGEDNVSVLSDWLGMSEAEVREGEVNGTLT